MNKRKILNDPVYGLITIPTDLIFDLIEHPYFQRLRRIKQVGLTHYVYPGALHTRFQHAIGAMHLMGQAIHSLRIKGAEISAEEEEAARVAILLHDIGHGPYSHALEYLLVPVSHEELTVKFMHALNTEFDGQLSSAIEIFEGTHPRKFLHQLVSGQLDMDRLDYLRRDSFFTGVAEGVISHDRIIAMLNLVDDEIVLEEKGLFSIEKFLVARRLMYLQVYLHKAVISAEQMIRQLIMILREELAQGVAYDIPDVLDTLLKHTTVDSGRGDTGILNAFSHIDDVEVDYALKTLCKSENTVIRILANGLIERKLFRTIFHDQPIDMREIDRCVGIVSRSLGLSEGAARQLVLTGSEAVPTYDGSQGEIRILSKDGSIRNLPELLTDKSSLHRYERHFLSMPKTEMA